MLRREGGLGGFLAAKFGGLDGSQMDNLESAICDVQEEIAQVRSRRAELDQALQALETRWRMLEGKAPETHRHRCPHCGSYAVCPQAYGEDCPLDAAAPADCRDDPYPV